jgi:hypothetical protein
MARIYQRNAENLEKRAQAEDKKVTDLSVKLGRSAGEPATAEENLALHRQLIDVQYWPAATPEDLLDGLNDLRPHVVHFSGHAGDAAVLFDNASVDSPQGHEVPFELLAAATYVLLAGRLAAESR